jgi:hypothetical protein
VLIDQQFRCLAVASAARRCQLYADHDGAHAYGWREQAAHPHTRGRPLSPFTCSAGMTPESGSTSPRNGCGVHAGSPPRSRGVAGSGCSGTLQLCHDDEVVAAGVALLKGAGHQDQAVGHAAVGGP